jgi:hypothetical protein
MALSADDQVGIGIGIGVDTVVRFSHAGEADVKIRVDNYAASITDGLTGAHNRRNLNAHLGHTIA